MIIFSGENNGETCWDKATFYPAQYGAFSTAGMSHESSYEKKENSKEVKKCNCDCNCEKCKESNV